MDETNLATRPSVDSPMVVCIQEFFIKHKKIYVISNKLPK
jgi:uncharacterized pyridoxamine 5'-phosphate oxidase family protein